MNKGYALIAAAMMNDGFLQFSGVGISDGGYVAQEVAKIQKSDKLKQK